MDSERNFRSGQYKTKLRISKSKINLNVRIKRGVYSVTLGTS